jgi:hypothetical protein
MGKGMDTVSKAKAAQDKYLANEWGVKDLLQSYRGLVEHGFYSHDKEALDIRIDFETALQAYVLDGVHRASLALIYGLELTLAQASRLTNYTVKELREAQPEALSLIFGIMNGEIITPYKKVSPSQADNIQDWLEEIIEGRTFIFDIPEAVTDELMGMMKDKLSQEVKRQQVEGQPLEGENGLFDIMGYFPYELERYPYHKTIAYIEDPNRKGNFRFGSYDEADYFRSQDRRNGVDAFPEEVTL